MNALAPQIHEPSLRVRALAHEQTRQHDKREATPDAAGPHCWAPSCVVVSSSVSTGAQHSGHPTS